MIENIIVWGLSNTISNNGKTCKWSVIPDSASLVFALVGMYTAVMLMAANSLGM